MYDLRQSYVSLLTAMCLRYFMAACVLCFACIELICFPRYRMQVTLVLNYLPEAEVEKPT